MTCYVLQQLGFATPYLTILFKFLIITSYAKTEKTVHMVVFASSLIKIFILIIQSNYNPQIWKLFGSKYDQDVSRRQSHASLITIIYHPPNFYNHILSECLTECLSTLESDFSNCGIILTDDFNHFSILPVVRQLKLKQLIKFPTQGSNTLDQILKNLHSFLKIQSYNFPQR